MHYIGLENNWPVPGRIYGQFGNPTRYKLTSAESPTIHIAQPDAEEEDTSR